MFFRKRNARLTFSESKIRLLNRGKFIPISLRSNREIELFDLFFSLYLSGIGRIAKIVNKEKKGHCLLFYFRVPNSTPFFPISKSYFPHLISLCIWKESLSFEAQIFRSLFWIFFFPSKYRMSAVAVCRRVGQIGTNSGIFLGRNRGFGAPLNCDSFVSISGSRQISQLVKSNGKRLFLVDTLALVISLPFCYSFQLIREML